MYLNYLLDMNVPFLKDCWGYKCDYIMPGVYYGDISTCLILRPTPSHSVDRSESEKRLVQLLDGEPVEEEVMVLTGGVANHKLLEHPGALGLKLFSQSLPIDLKLLDYSVLPGNRFNGDRGQARCSIRLKNKVGSIDIPKGTVIKWDQMMYPPPQVLKTWLLNPERFYFSHELNCLMDRPKDLNELSRLYEMESPKIAPTSDMVREDPLSFVDFALPLTRKFARVLVNGEFMDYLIENEDEDADLPF